MKTFEDYLQEKNYTLSTIATYCKYIALLENWAREENLVLHELKYRDLISFIHQCTVSGKSKKHINQHLTVIRHYWNYLLSRKKVKDNIAAGVVVKGVTRRLPHDILSEEELTNIYERYPIENIYGKRNKIMLGLMVYQGLGTGEIKKLELSHIRLQKGEIEIIGGKRSERRILPLLGQQVLALHEFITVIRPVILAFADKQSFLLFTSAGKSEHLQNTICYLFGQIKKYFPKLKNIDQIRNSVIANWLNHYNLREVQYKAGHRYVSSTERYQSTNLDDLKKEVGLFHPLK